MLILVSVESQSPSLRGSGRFSHTLQGEWDWDADVSIPFIAGQWSLLHSRYRPKDDRNVSQSPSLRGSGRFKNTENATR